MSCSVENAVGEHTLFFVYNGEGEDDLMEIQSWQFTEKEPQPEVDKTALKEAIDKASEINSSEYTNASLEKLYEALEAAKDVYEDETAEQAAVDEAAAALNAAIDGLEKLPEVDPGTDPDKPGTTPGDDTDKPGTKPGDDADKPGTSGKPGSGSQNQGGSAATGDPAEMTVWAVLLLAGAGGAAAAYTWKRKSRKA